MYLHQKNGFFLLNYIDDFLGSEYENKIWTSHPALVELMSKIGASRTEKKSIKPNTVIEFIGNLFNTVTFTIGITPNRKVQLLQELVR